MQATAKPHWTRWLECIGLFGLIPIPLYYLVLTPAADYPIDLGGFEPRRIIFPLLWLIAILAMVKWRKKHPGQKIFRAIDWSEFRRYVLPRFLISCVCMTGLVLLLMPERLLQFPQERTALWAMVMLLYPLVSVVPQEVVFRLFFFDRYQALLGNGWLMVLVSGLAFGHAHLMFNNSFAYVLSIIGGVMFSLTYQRTRSLSLVWLEHALYGQFIFTIGLGWYFFTGAAASHG